MGEGVALAEGAERDVMVEGEGVVRVRVVRVWVVRVRVCRGGRGGGQGGRRGEVRRGGVVWRGVRVGLPLGRRQVPRTPHAPPATVTHERAAVTGNRENGL